MKNQYSPKKSMGADQWLEWLHQWRRQWFQQTIDVSA